MKRLFLVFYIFLFSAMRSHSEVRFSVLEGLDNDTVVRKIEENASAFFTEINAAQSEQRTPNLGALRLNQSVQTSVLMLWENCPFYCSDEELVEHCVVTRDGYQIRNIPLLMTLTNPETFKEDEYQEGVLNFTRQGEIESFHLSLSNSLYIDVVKDNKDITDLHCRQMVLDFVEQLFTGVCAKDAVSLDNLLGNSDFSDMGVGIGMHEFVRTVKKDFKRKGKATMVCDKIEVTRHPARDVFYGVNLHFDYATDYYSQGYFVFFLFDFHNEIQPVIHIGTVQLDRLEDGSPLPAEDIITLRHFNI